MPSFDVAGRPSCALGVFLFCNFHSLSQCFFHFLFLFLPVFFFFSPYYCLSVSLFSFLFFLLFLALLVFFYFLLSISSLVCSFCLVFILSLFSNFSFSLSFISPPIVIHSILFSHFLPRLTFQHAHFLSQFRPLSLSLSLCLSLSLSYTHTICSSSLFLLYFCFLFSASLTLSYFFSVSFPSIIDAVYNCYIFSPLLLSLSISLAYSHPFFLILYSVFFLPLFFSLCLYSSLIFVPSVFSLFVSVIHFA
ncbi:unnamed protein product [Acanthosepion pharaonis]|uniref:Uncharacterized protein n=1 Tax=Acanthosepion pharaonis TaxID=158019 RepID=A0A812C8I4_ACAPH|nr:unnamed protein product [Sepia pharaonis]